MAQTCHYDISMMLSLLSTHSQSSELVPSLLSIEKQTKPQLYSMKLLLFTSIILSAATMALASSDLRADVFLAPAIAAVPPIPIPDNITPIWSPTAATLVSSAHEAVLIEPLFTNP